MPSMTPKQRLCLERLHREFEWKFPSRPNEVREFIVNDPFTFNKDMMGMLLAKVQTLESQMSAVMRILNIRHDALDLTGPEYKNLHIMAEHYSTEGWPPHAEETWADLFVRFRIEDLEQIAQVTDDQHPWRPFLKLVSTMHLNSYDTTWRNQLASGKTNIFQVAGIWCTLKGETSKTFDLLVKRDAEPSRKLVRKLQNGREQPH